MNPEIEIPTTNIQTEESATLPPTTKPNGAGPMGKLWKGLLFGVLGVLLVYFLLFFNPCPCRSSDKASCVMNIRNFQTVARALWSEKPENAHATAPVDSAAVHRYMEISSYHCPSGGTYTVHGLYGDPPGTVFLRCSHPDHAPTPAQSANW